MHNHDEVYCCVGLYVCARADVEVLCLIVKAGRGEEFAEEWRKKKKRETEFPGCKRKER